VHDTPDRVAKIEPGGLALATIDQADPVHDSTSCEVTVPLTELPTAVQADVPVQDTASSALCCEGVGSGDGTMVQVDPEVAPAGVDAATAHTAGPRSSTARIRTLVYLLMGTPATLADLEPGTLSWGSHATAHEATTQDVRRP
jgi:hypothetical protein